MNSLSFDQAVSFYDRTRALPPEKAELLTGRLMALGRLAEPGRRGLEVGAGSGRISVPLLERGARMTGIDISREMLGLMGRKRAGAPLVQGDAARLPFPAATFDTVLMVHVLHVIADWQAALREVQRVLRPGGLLLHVWNERDPAEAYTRLKTKFAELAALEGESARRPGAADREDGVAFWREQGWPHEIEDVTEWREEITPARFLQRMGERMWSSSWALSDQALDATLARLADWAEAEFGDLDALQPHTHTLRIDVVRPRS